MRKTLFRYVPITALGVLLAQKCRLIQRGVLALLCLVAPICVDRHVAAAQVAPAPGIFNLPNVGQGPTAAGITLGTGLEPSSVTLPVRKPTCAVVPGETQQPAIHDVASKGIGSNVGTWGALQLFYAKDEAAITRAESSSVSVDASAGIPFVSAFAVNFDTSRETTSASSTTSLTFVLSESVLSYDFSTLAKPTVAPSHSADTFVADCGTQYVARYVYGAKIGYVITLSDLSDDERYAYTIGGGAKGNGLVDDLVEVSGDGSVRFKQMIQAHAKKHSVFFKAFGYGSPFIQDVVLHLPDAQAFGSYDDIISNINSIAESAAKSNPGGVITGPVGFVAAQYPNPPVPGTYSGRSANKVIVLRKLVQSLRKVQNLYAHALDYQHPPWNKLTVPSDARVLALAHTLKAFGTSYTACYGVGITDGRWNSAFGPAECHTADVALANLQLDLHPEYNLATPPPISGRWVNATTGTPIIGATKVSTDSVDPSLADKFPFYFEVSNAYLTTVALTPAPPPTAPQGFMVVQRRPARRKCEIDR